MSSIYLRIMTKELSRRYHMHFEMDPDMFMNPNEFRPYVYTEESSDEIVERYHKLGRIYLAVMLDEEPIGEVILKHINPEEKHCTLGISMRSDQYKNKGYGTQAEILTLMYAFGELDMKTVYADAILRNTRSQHVLKKVGFIETHQDDTFRYYRCDRSNWKHPNKLIEPNT